MKRLLERVRFLESHRYDDAGYYVEKWGETVAELVNACRLDNEWTHYQVVPRTSNAKYARLLRNDLFQCDVQLRNRQMPEYCMKRLCRCDCTAGVSVRGPQPGIPRTFLESLLMQVRDIFGCSCTPNRVKSRPLALPEFGIRPEEAGDILVMFTELEWMAFKNDPDFGSVNWVPQSVECREFLNRIVSPENLPKLRRWYEFLAKSGYKPPGADLKEYIESVVGQKLSV